MSEITYDEYLETMDVCPDNIPGCTCAAPKSDLDVMTEKARSFVRGINDVLPSIGRHRLDEGAYRMMARFAQLECASSERRAKINTLDGRG